MLHIVLYRPEKPQNTGNIMRTCVAIHATLHIIGPITFSIDSKDLKRVGMDYIDDLKMHFCYTFFCHTLIFAIFYPKILSCFLQFFRHCYVFSQILKAFSPPASGHFQPPIR